MDNQVDFIQASTWTHYNDLISLNDSKWGWQNGAVLQQQTLSFISLRPSCWSWAESHSVHCSIMIFNLICLSLSLSPETSDRRVPLLRAAREQQLQHLPLQEVPQHVRGTEADWPVQVWKQNRTGSEGHSFPSNVGQILIRDLGEIY